MLPRDYEPGGDSAAWQAEYEAWMAAGAQLAEQQRAWRQALDSELATVAMLEEEHARAVALRDNLAADDAQIAQLDERIRQSKAAAATLEPPIAEAQGARETSTARLLGNLSHRTPLVLLPVRVETRWTGTDLRVRIFPDELEIDSHEPALTSDERRWGEHWWQCEADLRRAAWRQLAERFGVTRAAWIVAATDPDRPGELRAGTSEGSWTRAPLAVGMPDRWAVLGLAGEEPVLTAWSAPVRDPLPASISPDGSITAAAGNEWLTGFGAAEEAGMAVTIPAAQLDGRTLDALLVLGVRTAGGEPLAALLDAQHYTRGLRLLGAGGDTNNTATGRAAHTRRPDPDRAYEVERGGPRQDGAGMARLLGVDAGVLAHVELSVGDDLDARAMHSVLSVASGALRDRLLEESGAEATASLWGHARPAGHVPSLVVGSQPYGVVAATALGRWVAGADDPAAAAGAALRRAWPEWQARARGPRARRAWADPLVDVITEHATSTRFTLTGGGALNALERTVGAPGPDGRPAEPYLLAIAGADQPDPHAVPAILLARLAAAAKQRAAPAERPALDGMLRHLATLSAQRLHDLLAGALDVLSHRFDAWAAALAHARAGELDGAPRAVGAYGIVHVPRPRENEPQSQGFVHAPSLDQAATAAVLRSSFRAQPSSRSRTRPSTSSRSTARTANGGSRSRGRTRAPRCGSGARSACRSRPRSPSPSRRAARRRPSWSPRLRHAPRHSARSTRSTRRS